MAATPAPAPGSKESALQAGSLLNDVIEILRGTPVILLPFVILGVLSSGGGGDPGLEFEFNGGPPPWQLFPVFAFFGVIALAVAVLLFLLYALAWLMTTHAALAAVNGHRTPDLRQAFQDARPVYWGGAWTFLLWCLIVFVGFILLIVPGFIALAGLAPWAAVVVTERRTGGDAIQRAWELTRGHRMDLFLLLLLAGAVAFIASLLLGWIPIIGGALAGAVNGVVYAAVAVLGALFYTRRAGGARAEDAGPVPTV